MHLIVLRTTIVFFFLTQALAQVETQTELIEQRKRDSFTLEDLICLDKSVRHGKLVKARQLGCKAIRAYEPALQQAADDCSGLDQHYVLLWVATTDNGTYETGSDGKYKLRRLVVPQPADNEHSADLPGIGTSEGDKPLYELFISPDKQATVTSIYKSTREDDPLIAQVPAFATAILTPGFSIFSAVAGRLDSRTKDATESGKPDPLFLTKSAVRLPYRRASIDASSTASIPKEHAALIDELEELAIRVPFEDAPLSEWSQPLANRLKCVVQLKVGGLAGPSSWELQVENSPSGANTSAKSQIDKIYDENVNDCTDLLGEPFPNDALLKVCKDDISLANECIEKINSAFNALYEHCLKHCIPGKDPSDVDKKLMKVVDGKFREFVQSAGPQRVEAKFSFYNRPLTHFGFGAGSAVVVGGSVSKPRVKLDGGKVTADPLDRVLTTLHVTISPRGYDSGAFRPSWNERIRLFAGAAVTPDFGGVGGLSFLITRGFGFIVGGGALFTKAVDSPDEIGQAPVNSGDPFKLGVARVFFVGASFNFK